MASSQQSRKKGKNKPKEGLLSPTDTIATDDLDKYICQCLTWAKNEDRALLAVKFRETSGQINSVLVCSDLSAQVTGNLVELMTSSVFTKPSKTSKEIFKQIYTNLIHSKLMYPGGPLDNLVEQSFDGDQGRGISVKHITNIVHLYEVLINKLPEKLHLFLDNISKLIDKSETCSDASMLPHELKERIKGLSTILKKLRSDPLVDSISTEQSGECDQSRIAEFKHSSGTVGKHDLTSQTENIIVSSESTFGVFKPYILPIHRESTELNSSRNICDKPKLLYKANEGNDSGQFKKATKPSKEPRTPLIIPKVPTSKARSLQSTGFSKLSILPRNKSEIIHKKSKPQNQNTTNTPHQYIEYLFEQLREESLFPIRKSLTCFFSKKGKSLNKYLYIYEDVHCRRISCSDKEGVVFDISFSPVGVKDPEKYEWVSSKRLRFGSVICIFTKSKQYFDKIYFATIVKRNAREMSRRLCVSIRFEDGVPLGFDPSLGYTMIESKSSHFKHLHNCMRALLSININSIPIQDVLLGECCHSLLPAYIKSREQSDSKIGEWQVKSTTLDRLQYSSVEFALTNHIALFKAPNLIAQYNTSELLIKVYLQNRKRVLQSLPTQLSYQFDERIVLQRLAEMRSRLNLKLDINFYSVLCLSPLLVILPDTETMDSFLEQIHNTENNFIRLNSRNSSKRLLAAKSLCEVTDRYLNAHDLPQEILRLKSQIKFLQSKLFGYRKKLWHMSQDTLHSRPLTELNIQQVVSPEVYESLFHSNIANPKSIPLIDYWLADGTSQVISVVPPDAVPLPLKIPDAPPISTDNTLSESTEQIPKVQEISDVREEQFDDLFWGDFGPSLEDTNKLEAQYCNYSVEQTGLQQYGDMECFQSSDSAESESSDIEDDFFDEILEETLDREIHNQIPAEMSAKLNVWKIDLSERVRLYELWEKKFREQLFEDLIVTSEEVNKVVTEIASVRSDLDTYIMKQAALIATTPVEGVKFCQQLKQLKPRIVIIHSASYLKESELVALLTDSVTHLILFDDLSTANPKESKSSNSNCLIHKLVKNEFKHFSLSPNLVMRPEIAALTQSYIDVESDPNLPGVMGVSQNIFFVDSTSPESSSSKKGTDFTNQHEANFLVQLAKYLLKQGYFEKDISIYTFYPAQRVLINSLLRKANIRNNLKLSLVTPSAKRQSRISLVSLVRSNKLNDIGTLTNPEMVYTAFSSASEGLYVIGNVECIRASSDRPMIWEIILDEFKSNLSMKLPLACKTHGNATLVDKDKDFKQVRNGGCLTPCSVKLSCGHVCPQICHPDPHTGTECVQCYGQSTSGPASRDENSVSAKNSTLYTSSLDETQHVAW